MQIICNRFINKKAGNENTGFTGERIRRN